MNSFLPVLLGLLLLGGCGASAAQPAPTAVPAPVATAAPTSTATPVPTPAPTPAPPLAGRVICVDPGHGVTDQRGSEAISPLSSKTKAKYVSGTAGRYQTEEQLNLSVGLKLRDALTAQGATVVMTRETHEAAVSNIERAAIANGSAEVCVRIHADGSTSAAAHGLSVLIPAGELLGTPSIAEESARLGQLMADETCARTGAKALGTIQRTDLTAFNWSQIPVVLLEMGFMTNADEDAALATDAYQQQLVDGMAAALVTWYQGR